MKIYKVKHVPTGRFLTGSNYTPLSKGKKEPVGKIWNYFKDAEKYVKWICCGYRNTGVKIEDLLIVEYDTYPVGTYLVKP